MRGRLNRQVAVVAGFVCVVAGAFLHWPDFFFMADSTRFRMVGMPMSPTMITGMALIAVGLALATYGLMRPARTRLDGVRIDVKAMDERPLSRADFRLAAILIFGLVIDVMKPATIGFVLPGARAEYHLGTLQIALWPLVALTGTTVGSIVWGLMADWIGRRGGLLLAALLFVATSICGAMPSYWLNLVMCFVMGMSAGGMLPLVFSLLSEIAPRRHRGLLGVLIGGLGAAGGYLAASAAAALLEPSFSWRLLWMIGLPTGFVLILFSRYIPESPRFLVITGREEEARRTMRQYGATLESVPEPEPDPADQGAQSLWTLLRPPFALQTFALLLFGFAWGMANFGFLTWLPTLLRGHAANAALWNGVLAKSALIALPGALLVTLLYGRWRTRASIGTLALMSSGALVVLGLVITRAESGVAVGALAILLLVGINGSNAMLSVYTSEVYPTVVRGRGTGLVAAATKLGGLLGPQVVALVLVLGGSATTTAWLMAGPLLVGGLILWRKGVETRERSLADIQLAMRS